MGALISVLVEQTVNKGLHSGTDGAQALFIFIIRIGRVWRMKKECGGRSKLNRKPLRLR